MQGTIDDNYDDNLMMMIIMMKMTLVLLFMDCIFINCTLKFYFIFGSRTISYAIRTRSAQAIIVARSTHRAIIASINAETILCACRQRRPRGSE